jgi:dihydroxyacetone kinase DhaKLM complex PTS-EIIA-like component DhaM
MNAKEAVNEIKAVLAQFGLISAPAKASFKLEDNTIVQVKELKIGESIEKINENFELVTLEDGSYVLEEGFSIEVKDGKVESVKEVFADAKLVDGTIVRIAGDLASGSKVVVVTDNAEIPAPDGTHDLEDGSQIETKDGVIVNVIPASADEEMPAEGTEAPMGGEEVSAQPSEAQNPEMVEFVDMLKDFINNMNSRLGAIQSKMEAMNTEFEAFKKEPGAKKIANGKTEFNKETPDSSDSMVAGIMELRKLNKK